MSRHQDEHRSCEAMTTSGGRLQHPEQHHESSSSLGHVLSDTDSGVADTEDVAAGRSARSRNTGARPRTSTATPQTATASTSSNVDLQTLRDPSHYEELSVIGNGKFFSPLFKNRKFLSDLNSQIKNFYSISFPPPVYLCTYPIFLEIFLVSKDHETCPLLISYIYVVLMVHCGTFDEFYY